MIEIIRQLNSREIANIFWITAIIVGFFFIESKDVRNSLKDILKACLDKKITTLFFLKFSYLSIATIILFYLKYWQVELLKDTVIWSLFIAIPLLFQIVHQSDKIEFKDILLNNISLIAIVEFISNTYTFNFFIELSIFPIVNIIAVLNACSELNKEYKDVYKITSYVMSVFGVGVIFFCFGKIFIDYKNFFTLLNIKSFLLPIVYSFFFLPFLYLFRKYIIYENKKIRKKIECVIK